MVTRPKIADAEVQRLTRELELAGLEVEKTRNSLATARIRRRTAARRLAERLERVRLFKEFGGWPELARLGRYGENRGAAEQDVKRADRNEAR